MNPEDWGLGTLNTESAVTWLTWLLAGVGAAALVLIVMIRRLAGRVVVIGLAALLLVVLLAVRVQLSAIPTDSPEPLCKGGVSWFGIQLTGPDSLCTKYR